jgi:hypothetical protein
VRIRIDGIELTLTALRRGAVHHASSIGSMGCDHTVLECRNVHPRARPPLLEIYAAGERTRFSVSTVAHIYVAPQQVQDMA